MSELELLVESYRNFRECILLDLIWQHQGTKIGLKFNYVWDRHGLIRSDLERDEIVIVWCEMVQSFSVYNDLSAPLIEHPDQIDWGLSEIASLRVNGREATLVEGHRLIDIALRWNDERRIDVTAVSFSIEHAPPG